MILFKENETKVLDTKEVVTPRKHVVLVDAGLVRAFGASTAILLSQLKYWGKLSKTGWIRRTIDQLSYETGLSRRTIFRILSFLEEAEIVERKHIGKEVYLRLLGDFDQCQNDTDDLCQNDTDQCQNDTYGCQNDTDQCQNGTDDPILSIDTEGIWGGVDYKDYKKDYKDHNKRKEKNRIEGLSSFSSQTDLSSQKEKNRTEQNPSSSEILEGITSVEEKHENIVKNAPLVKNFTNEIQNLPPHQKALLPPRVRSEKMIEAVRDLTPEDFEDLKVLVKTVLNSDITSDTKLKVFLVNLRLHKFSSWNGVKEFLLQIRTFRRKTDVKDMNLDSMYRKYFYEIRKIPIYSSDTEVSVSYSSVAQAVQNFRRYIDCAYAVQEFAVHWAHVMLRSIEHSQIFAELKPFLSETFDQFGYQVYRLSDVDGFKHYVKQIYYSQKQKV